MKKKGFRKFWMFGVAATIALVFAITPMSFAARALTSGDQTIYGAKTFEHDATFKKNLTVEGALLGVSQVSTEYYVCSTNGHDSSGNYGSAYLKPFATIDYAINQCTANKGDVIHVLPGHAESYTAADGFDADVAGITIIGYGTGTDMPEFTFADTDATVALGAANVTLYNLRFLAGISAVVMGVSVEAAADDCAIIACEFPEPTTDTFEFVRAIMLATGADRLLVEKCKYLNADATGTTNFIDIDTGIVNGVQIVDNYVYGEFAEGAIHTDKVCLEMLIKDNTIVNMTTGQHGIEIAADATGLMVNNLVSTDAIGTSYDVGHLNEHDNYWDDYGTYDTTAVPWTTNETGVNRWGASELAQIEGEVQDALQAGVSGSYVAVNSSVTSSQIPNNTQTAGAITGASSGGLLLINIYANTDGTGLVAPTNIEFSVDNAAGLTGAGAPIALEAIAGLGATKCWNAEDDATSHNLPLYLETGKKVFIHGDDAAGTGVGVATFTLVFQRVTDDATIAGADLTP